MQPNNPSTLSLSQLIDRLNAEQFKGIDTNVVEVDSFLTHTLYLATVDSAAEEEIENLKDQLASAEKESENLKKEIDELNERNISLQELADSANQQFANIQCGDVTAKDLRERAQDAKAEAERWKTIAMENKEVATRATEELVSLRRRKGVESWIYRNMSKIKSLINLANSMNERKTDIDTVARYAHELTEEIKNNI